MNKALLIVAHGSRKEESNSEIFELAKKIASKVNSFDMVEACFLEIAKPSIPEGIETCVSNKATEILIMPYFLAAGRHVLEDIPSIVDEEKVKYSDILIKSLPYFGSNPVIVDILNTLAENDA